MTADTEAIVRTVSELLAEGPELQLAVLFGSRARGGPVHPRSDVDLALLPVDPELTLHDELRLQSRLASALGCEVDLVRLDHAAPMLRWRIASEGVLVLSAPPAAYRSFLARAALEHADMAELMGASARRLRSRLARGAAGAHRP